MAKGKYEAWLSPENLLRLEDWARDGLIMEQIAHNVGCNVKTLREWRNRYPPIGDAIKRGRDVPDIEVTNALHQRSVGYYYDEITQERVVNPDTGESEMQVTKIVRKHVPGDPSAQRYWLNNRRPDRWRNNPVDETDSATLTEARKLLGGIHSAINGKGGG